MDKFNELYETLLEAMGPDKRVPIYGAYIQAYNGPGDLALAKRSVNKIPKSKLANVAKIEFEGGASNDAMLGIYFEFKKPVPLSQSDSVDDFVDEIADSYLHELDVEIQFPWDAYVQVPPDEALSMFSIVGGDK
jgi:hypothetical protein